MMYNAPHTPLQAPDEAVQPYLDAGLSPGVAITYAMNEIMDRGVRRITETLDALGLADDTILMFTSDNGPAFATRPDQVPAGMSPDLYHTRRYNCGFNGQKKSVYEGRYPGADDHALARRAAFRWARSRGGTARRWR
jgi:arylsulfatase A-like enzyme